MKLDFDLYGIDNFNDYYDINLKKSRLNELKKLNICNKTKVIELFNSNNFDIVIHLAAQAGVRYSITNPNVYMKINISGFLNILESSKEHFIKHLVFSSSSSVYVSNEKMSFCEDDNIDHLLSLYGTKKRVIS